MVEGGVNVMRDEKNVKFEKGKVSEYNGQQDIYCDFVTVTQGEKQDIYYLLNDKKLDNGFYIASTVLKEAIDPQILRTHLGLIDKNGNVCIPFENKIVKVVENKYLLVVRTEARTQSVIDAVFSRNDPTAAERMVNTNASIRDKLNEYMNNHGNFLLNDLLSEGTIYTVDGRNIFNNQYYSFIGMTDSSFYCSSNVPESSIIEVPREDLFEVRPNNIEKDSELTSTTVIDEPVFPKKDPLDITGVIVPKNSIDVALNSSTDGSEDEKNSGSPDFSLPPISIDKLENSVKSTGEEISSNSDILEDKTEITSVEEDSLDFDDDAKVVGVISNIIRENERLHNQVSDLQGGFDDLLHEKDGDISRLEGENSRLKKELEKLTAENARLLGIMEQIKSELGFSKSSQYSMKKVA